MRNRKWVLVICIVGSIISIGSYYGWRLARANEKIREALLNQIRPYLAKESDIGNIDFDLNTLHLREVKLASKEKSFYLKIKDIHLRYSLWELIRFGFVPNRITREIILDRPELVIRNLKEPRTNGEGNEWVDLRGILENLDVLNKVAVIDGSIQIEDDSGTRLELASGLNGLLDSKPADSAVIRLVGRLFHSRGFNLKMRGAVSLLNIEPVWIQVILEDSDIPDRLPLILPDSIRLSSGKMVGEMNFFRDRRSTGVIHFRNATLINEKNGLYFKGVNIEARLDGKNITVDGGVNDFCGSDLKISGKITNVFNPFFDILVSSDDFNAASFLREYANIDLKYIKSDNGELKVKLQGSVGSPLVKGSIYLPIVTAGNIRMGEFRGSVYGKNNQISFNGSGDLYSNLRMEVKGSVAYGASSIAVDINGDVKPLLPEWVGKRIERCSAEMNINFSGMRGKMGGRAECMISAVDLELDTLLIKQEMEYKNDVLKLNISSNSDFNLNARINGPFEKNPEWNASVAGLNLFMAPFINRNVKWIADDLTVDANLTGKSNLIKIDARIKHIDTRDDIVKIVADAKRVQKDLRKISINGSYYCTDGRVIPLLATGWVSSSGLKIDIGTAGEFASMKGSLPFNRDGSLSANVEFEEISLGSLSRIFPVLRSFNGSIKGGIRASGTIENPEVNLKLTLRDGVFNDIGGFTGGVDYLWKDHKFRMCSLSIIKDSTLLLSGGAQQLRGDSLVGGFWAKDLDLQEIYKMFGRKESRIQGRGNIEIRISGRSDRPIAKGTLEVRDGKVDFVDFKELEVVVVDTILDSRLFYDGRISIEKGKIEREDGTKIMFWGKGVHGKESHADISIYTEGDFLQFLPHLSPVIKKASCNGEAFLSISGKYGSWALAEGRIDIKDGKIELNSFIDKIKKVRCFVKIEKGEKFVNIEYMKGKIDGEEIFITNSSSDEFGGEYPDFELNNLGVNLGVLQLRSSGKGLHCNIPGLMYKGDKGWIDFDGLKQGEPFLIAGPASSPSVIGIIRLTETRFTYPPLKLDNSGVSSDFINFLQNINWDVRIIPFKDVNFVQSIETPMGNLYSDIQLRDKYGDFRIRGRINDQLIVWGSLLSTEGSIEVLDHHFRIEQIRFDYPMGADDPIVSGKAFTTVFDSLGVPSTVWLNLTSIDSLTGIEIGGGQWKNIHFRFSTDNPNLARSEADLMSAMGYSSESLASKAYDVIGLQLENKLIRPIFRPFENSLRRYLGLDIFRVSSMISRNIMEMRIAGGYDYFDPRLLLRRTKFTLGKYLMPGLFIIYSGQIQSGIGFRYPIHGVGFKHALTIEYALRPDLFIEMEYMYNSLLLSNMREDKRIWIRHVFPF